MSLCNPCTTLKKISLCTDSLIIGYVSLYNFNVPYKVYFKSLSTDKIFSYSVTSDTDGLLTLFFTDGFPLATGQAYEMWINQSGDSIETQEELTIGDTTKTCYIIQANKVFDMYYDENVNFDSQTLEVS